MKTMLPPPPVRTKRKNLPDEVLAFAYYSRDARQLLQNARTGEGDYTADPMIGALYYLDQMLRVWEPQARKAMKDSVGGLWPNMSTGPGMVHYNKAYQKAKKLKRTWEKCHEIESHIAAGHKELGDMIEKYGFRPPKDKELDQIAVKLELTGAGGGR